MSGTGDTTPNDRIRSAIENAVEREINNILAPIKDRVTTMAADMYMLHRDFGDVRGKVEELQDVVLGNARLKLPGLQVEIQDVGTKISTLLKERDSLLAEIRGARKALYVVGALASVPFLQQLGLFNLFAKLLGIAP